MAKLNSSNTDLAISHNLPYKLTGLVGRGRELDQLENLIIANRLLTLTGIGGVGKTRLALQTAWLMQDQFKEGVWLVELATLNQPELVGQVVATTLGVRDDASSDSIAALKRYFNSGAMLLVLDNCEHLITQCANLAESLLQSCPQLHILVTSREPLLVGGELNWPVPALSLPPLEAPTSWNGSKPASSNPFDFEAVQLFVERAKVIQPNFELTDSVIAVVVEICQNLDGIPLALELAAARLRTLSIEQIAARLTSVNVGRFKLLTGGSRTALPRQQTLQALIDWSFTLLTASEKIALRRLAIFIGGWFLEAAEAVCVAQYSDSAARLQEGEVLNLLEGLVNKSLVVVEQDKLTARSRYRLLETVREYSWLKLVEAGELQTAKELHRQWYQSWAENSIHQVQANFRLWQHQIGLELGNLRLILADYKSDIQAGPTENWLKLCVALWLFWFRRSFLSEGRGWLEAALERTGWSATLGPENTLRAEALQAIGILAFQQGDHTLARKMFEHSLPVSRALNDKPGLVNCLVHLAQEMVRQGDYDRAQAMLEECRSLLNLPQDAMYISISLHHLVFLLLSQQQYSQARIVLEEGLAINGPGKVILPPSYAALLFGMGIVNSQAGNFEQAKDCLIQSLEIGLSLDDQEAIGNAMAGLGAILGQAGQLKEAARLFGAALKLREIVNLQLAPLLRPILERGENLVRTGLTEVDWSKFWADGYELSQSAALKLAHQLVFTRQHGNLTTTPTTSTLAQLDNKDLATLTRREQDVLRLLAGGLTNLEIAEKLMVSHRTVEAHLRAIYDKLELNSRSAAIRYAIEHSTN